MARIIVIVEGPSEETFVNELLAPHLAIHRHLTSAKILGNARSRDKRGGIKGWAAARFDIVQHLLDDPHMVVTTMVDYYGLPQNGYKAWPGRAAAGVLAFANKAPTVASALHADVAAQLSAGFIPQRFIPYVMMHEFESLLFSDCARFAQAIERPGLEASFRAIVSACGSPEEINDSPQTAPSKRIEGLVPGYEKPLMGNLAALEIGLDRIRANCPLFNAWVTTLEGLP